MTKENSGTESEKPLILIVDDTPRNLQLLGTILRRANYNVSVATGGIPALRQLREISPDLILLDIMMPDIDGFEVCAEIRKDPARRDTPIIFLTGKTETEDIIKAFDIGATDYVMKPFRTAELLARVKAQLELKQSRDELNRKNEELERLNKSKDHFLSIVSHDLRSPFQGLLGLSGMLKNELEALTKEELFNIVELIDNSLNGVYKMVENLLSWTLIEMGRYKLAPVELDLKEVIQTQINLYSIQITDKKLTLKTNLEEKISIVVDEQAISTVFRNLFSNAIKFSSVNGTIEVCAKQADNGNARISVKDQGCGIDQKLIDQLTVNGEDRLQSHLGTKDEPGSGLGLVLCRDLIRLLNGEFKISSEMGKGSEFIFEVPLQAKE